MAGTNSLLITTYQSTLSTELIQFSMGRIESDSKKTSHVLCPSDSLTFYCLSVVSKESKNYV